MLSQYPLQSKFKFHLSHRGKGLGESMRRALPKNMWQGMCDRPHWPAPLFKPPVTKWSIFHILLSPNNPKHDALTLNDIKMHSLNGPFHKQMFFGECSHWMSPIFKINALAKWSPLLMPKYKLVLGFCTKIYWEPHWIPFFFSKTEGYTKRPFL